MTISKNNNVEKFRFDLNREAAKISALLFDQVDGYKYLWEDEILPPEQNRIIEHAKIAYYLLGKRFFKHTKINDEQKNKFKFYSS